MTIEAILTILCCGLGGTVLGFFGRHLVKTHRTNIEDIVEAKTSPIQSDINEIKLSLATQFGGNGGGMREAINSIRIEVAELRGEFRQIEKREHA